MADNTLASALNLQFSPSETNYGLAQGVLAQLAPSLISDYRSTGSNIGIGLGTILLSSLLGYKAQSQATQRGLQALELANAMQAEATTPEARVDYLKKLAASDTDTEVVTKLSTLANALSTQERLMALEDVKRKRTAEMDVLKEIAARQGIPLSDAETFLTKRKAAMEEATEPTAGGLPAGLQTPEELKAQQDKEFKDRQLMQNSRAKLQEDPVYKDAQDIRKLYSTATEAAALQSPAGDDLLIKTVERLGNPGNQVTLEEFRRGNVTTLMDRALGSARRAFSGQGQLSPQARADLLNVAKLASESAQNAYNSRLRSEMSFLKQMGVTEPLPSIIGPSKLFFTSREQKEIDSRLQALSGQEQNAAIPEPERMKAKQLKAQILQLLQNRQNYYEQ